MVDTPQADPIPAKQFSHRAMLLSMMAVFLLLWVVFPVLVPGASKVIELVTFPFRLLGIFVHEMGHGFSALFSGGSFLWFQMDLGGGVAITTGGFRVLTLLGGLLGPALFGACLLMASTRLHNLKPVFWILLLFFSSGVYYMLKPLWLSSQRMAGGNWSVFYLLSIIVPGGAAVLTWFMRSRADKWQRAFLQLLGILMCYAAFCDTNYIFMYEQLGNGLFSDARVVGSLFWPGGPEDLPRSVFNLVAVAICLLNLGLMTLGAWKALTVQPKKRSLPA